MAVTDYFQTNPGGNEHRFIFKGINTISKDYVFHLNIGNTKVAANTTLNYILNVLGLIVYSNDEYIEFLRISSIHKTEDSDNSLLLNVKFKDIPAYNVQTLITTQNAVLKPVYTNDSGTFLMKFYNSSSPNDPIAMDLDINQIISHSVNIPGFTSSQTTIQEVLRKLHRIVIDGASYTIDPSNILMQIIETDNIKKLRIRKTNMTSNPKDLLLVFNKSENGTFSTIMSFLNMYKPEELQEKNNLMADLRSEIINVYQIQDLEPKINEAVTYYIIQAMHDYLQSQRISLASICSENKCEMYSEIFDNNGNLQTDQKLPTVTLASIKNDLQNNIFDYRELHKNVLTALGTSDITKRLDISQDKNAKLQLVNDNMKRSARRAYLKFMAYNIILLFICLLNILICFTFKNSKFGSLLSVMIMFGYLLGFAILTVLGMMRETTLY
jgi:hypothetical protein